MTLTHDMIAAVAGSLRAFDLDGALADWPAQNATRYPAAATLAALERMRATGAEHPDLDDAIALLTRALAEGNPS